MLLRDAVCPPPHPPLVVRIAITMSVLLAITVGGTFFVCTRFQPKDADIPMLDATTFRDTGSASFRHLPVVATPEELQLARTELSAYAFEAFPAWLVTNPHRECPDRLIEVNRHLPALHAVDPWGTPYQFLCGAQHGVGGLHARSAGPDRMFDTTDDLASH